MLQTFLQAKPILELGINLELDKDFSTYCLLVTNNNLIPARMTAKIERVFLDEGVPHPHSSSLPIKLQWLHNPGNDSAMLGSEKVEVIRCKPYHLLNQKDGSRFIVDENGDIDFFGKADSHNTAFFLTISGATYDKFGIFFDGHKNVYYEMALYGGEDAPSKPVWRLNTVWCHFRIDGDEIHTDILASKPDFAG